MSEKLKDKVIEVSFYKIVIDILEQLKGKYDAQFSLLSELRKDLNRLYPKVESLENTLSELSNLKSILLKEMQSNNSEIVKKLDTLNKNFKDQKDQLNTQFKNLQEQIVKNSPKDIPASEVSLNQSKTDK
jgi:predicted nuclease with TOPRIM domain